MATIPKSCGLDSSDGNFTLHRDNTVVCSSIVQKGDTIK